MYPLLILREELVCLIILVFLAFISHTYRMGTDGKVFNRLLTFAMVHVIMDIYTVWLVNHIPVVSPVINHIAHLVFYLSAILFSWEIFNYVISIFFPERKGKIRRLSLLPVLIYVILLPFLKIEYRPGEGTWASAGSAVYVGYAVAYIYFLIALALILIRWRKLSRHIRYSLLPMMLILLAAETTQTLVREMLFTGGAITVVTVGFFFALENPMIVLERKAMMDAMTGVQNRNCYERDIREYDREFQENRNQQFIFLFADINNLKSVNGLYGHQTGDEYITFIAVALLNNLQAAEHIYRMGGDEFLAVYRDTDEETVIREIKRIRTACRQEAEKRQYSPMLAIGYSVSSPDYKSLHDVLRVADYMMYRNKAELKQERALKAFSGGAKLNLTGLTDRLFDAMCLSSERYYPYMQNMETGVTRLSPAMVEFFGLEGEFIADFESAWISRVHPEDRKAYQDDLLAAIQGKKRYHYFVYRVLDKNGQYVKVTCRGGLYHGRDGEPDIFSGYIVNHGAPDTVDAMTGLQNYDMFYDRIQEMIDTGKKAIILRIEINNLLRTRMIYGSDTEITLNKQIADLFLKEVQGKGTLYSSNGDHFGLILPGTEKSLSEALYARLSAACSAGVQAGGETIPVSLSAGALVLPDKRMKTKNEVRSALIFAMDASKFERHNQLVFFLPREEELNEDELGLLQSIHRDFATERKQFSLRFQPIIDLQSGALSGAEALLRWQSEKYGEIAPGRFISFLENDPGYGALGYTILREAVRWAADFRSSQPDFRISVNITALQLYEADFVDRVLSVLNEFDFPPDHLVLELTERCKEMNFDELAAQVSRLRENRIRVALDDMGTGFSTINLVLHLPVDEMKLDYGFTRELSDHPNDIRYAEMLCGYAERGQTDICFEGVESEDTLTLLRGFGRVLVQGYYFDKPMMPEDFTRKYANMPMKNTERK